MDQAQKYKIDKEKVSYKIIDAEAVILNLDNGNYYSLNAVSIQIWEALNQQKSLDEILSFLKEEYEAPEKELEDDLKEFVEDLEEEGFIAKT